jgi:RHS repeat-associated protein
MSSGAGACGRLSARMGRDSKRHAAVALCTAAVLGASTAFGHDGAADRRAAMASTAQVDPRVSAKAEASRRAYGQQSADEALATARKRHPGLFRLPVGRVLRGRLADGVVRHLDDRAALVEMGGRRMVAASSTPLTTRDADGGRSSVDLRLVRGPKGFAGRNPIVATHAPGSLGAGVVFDALGTRVVPLGGAADVAPELVDGRLFWANAAQDTDVAVVPTPGGFESFVHLRTEASPEALTMPVELPRGMVLRARGDGFAAEAGGRTLLTISRPRAVDAAGRPVALNTALTPEGLAITARHRGRGFTYPILVDPVVNANLRQGGDASQWQFTPGAQGEWSGGAFNGSFLYMTAYDVPEGIRGGFTARPPGDSYVYRYESPGFFVGSQAADTPCAELVLFRVQTGASVARRSMCGDWNEMPPFVEQPTERQPGPYGLRFSMYVEDPSPGVQYLWVGEASTDGLVFYYSDDIAPFADGVTAPVGWIGSDQSLTVAGRDSGVGVKSIAASSPDSGWSASGTNACTGSTKATYCPGSWSVAASSTGMPEGENHVRTTVTDLIGRQATGTSVVRIDRSAPAIEVGGPLADRAGGFVGEPLTLAVNATDGSVPADGSSAERLKARSGVRSVELLVDGAPVEASMSGTQRAEQPCAAGSCQLARDLDFDPAGLSEGSHQISVRAIDHVGHARTSPAFSVTVDQTAPELAVSGGLAAAEGTTLQPGDYDLGIDTTDAAGVEEIEVLVDGLSRELVQQPCAGGGCGLSHTFTFTGDAFTPGPHEVEVRVKDKSGKQKSKKIPVNGNQKLSSTAVAVGFEEYFALRSLAAGAGSSASVNLGSGNFTWHHRPVSNAGRGLSTDVDITYNSRSSELDLGHGYDEIGEGFSLSISSLTRVNEALDVRWVDKNNDKKNDVVTLTDPDGTMHRFSRRMNGTTPTDVFDPPPGVNLHLRRYAQAPSPKTWAATQADGTTHFFDECGYQRSAEDRNGNALTFTYEDAQCHPQTQGRRAKLLSVTDAGGRSLRIFYESDSPGTSSRIDYILDHENRRLDFGYYANNKLERITEATGTAQQRSFAFEYEQTGQTAADKDVIRITDPLGRDTWIDYSDDHVGDAARAPKFGLGERVISLTDRNGKPLGFEYVPGTLLETRLTDRRGKLWRYRTDSGFRLRELVDPLGTLTTFAWDTDNNPAQIVEAAGTADQATTAMSWNANGRLLSHTDGENRRTELVYRDHNGVHEAPSGIDAAGAFVSDLTKVTTPKGVATATVDDFATRYAYREPTDPVGFEDRGNVRSITDPEEFVTTVDYTPQGLVSREKAETERGQFAVTTFDDFDANGLPQLVTDARGNASAEVGDGQWRVRYDGLGRVTDIRDPRGTHVPSPTVDEENYTTEYAYDALDRVVLERIPKLSEPGAGEQREFIVRTTGYDANDNVVRTSDGNNAVTERSYTPMDDLELIKSPAVPHEGEPTPAREETLLRYDGEQNLIEQVLPKGTASPTVAGDYTTTFAYDDAGRRTVDRRQSRGSVVKDLVTSRAYDRRGNVIGVVDPNHNAAGGDPVANALIEAKRRWTYTYDDNDRVLTAIEDPGGSDPETRGLTTRFGYDANGNLEAITDPRGDRTGDLARYTSERRYDERDLLTDQIDPRDRRTHYELRGDGLVTSVTTPRGVASATAGDFTTTFTYDAMGNLVSRSVPWADGQYQPRDWRFTYRRNAVGDPVVITDARGNEFVNAFFDTGELRSTGRPGFWFYDAQADVIRERTPTDPAVDGLRGDPEVSDDAKGDFGSVMPEALPGMLPRAGLTRFRYDGEMRLTEVHDLAGEVHRLDRDLLGRIVKHTMPFGPPVLGGDDRTIELEYGFDRNGNLAATVDGDDHRTTYGFDQLDRLVSEARPGSATPTETTLFDYDANDNLIKRTTPRTTAWQYGFDAIDRQISTTDPDAKVTTYRYDAAGNRVFRLPPRGQGRVDSERYATFRTFNEANELTLLEQGRNVAGGARETRFEYDLDGNPTTITAPGSRRTDGGALEPQVTRRVYDARGLVWTQTTGTGNFERTVATEFDGNGNLRRLVNPAGVDRGTEQPRNADPGTTPTADSAWTEHSTVFTYDRDDLLASTYLPWGRKDSADGERWRQHVTRDERGRIRVIDAPHQLGQPSRKTTSYTHYENGWIRTSEDSGPNPHRLLYDYDRRGNQVLWSSEGKSRQVHRSFFPNGQLRERIAEKPDEANRSYTYDYNLNRSLTRITDHQKNRVTEFEYDALERQTRANETWGAGRDTKLDYDANGNVSVRRTDGRFDGTSYVGGKTTTFAYDEQDREIRTHVEQAGESTTRTTEAAYYPSDRFARRTRTRPNATTVAEQWFFADDGRLVRKTREPAGRPVESETYRYDDLENGSPAPEDWGNGRRDANEQGTYVFNARGQMRRWTPRSAPGFTATYDVDGSGAVQRFEFAGEVRRYFYTGDRLDCEVRSELATGCNTTLPRTDYRYNVFDNIEEIDDQEDNTKDRSYEHDGFERLIQTLSGQATQGVGYEYDALDRRDVRIDERENNQRFEYAYIGATEALSREEAEGETRFYDYDSRLRRLGQARKSGTSPLTYRAYSLDANGTVLALEADDGSTTADSYAYGPYGDQRNNPSDDAAANPFRFQGSYYDTDAEAYDLRARMYRPDIGRFLSPDRYESAAADLSLQLDPTTNNRYVFSAADPINNIDIDGHEPPSSYTNGCDVLYGSDDRCGQESEAAQETSERDQRTVTYAYTSNWQVGRMTSAEEDQRFARNYAVHHVGLAEATARQAETFKRTGVMLPLVAPPAPRPKFDQNLPPAQPLFPGIRDLVNNPPDSFGDMVSAQLGVACGVGLEVMPLGSSTCATASMIGDEREFERGRRAGGEAGMVAGLAGGGVGVLTRGLTAGARSLAGSSRALGPGRVTAKGGGAADHAVPIGPGPEKAWKVLDRVLERGAPFPGYRGGGTFENRGPGMRLPESGPSGPISYREWDVNPYTRGVNRGGERLVTGSDGSAYYTTNHYDTFVRIR